MSSLLKSLILCLAGAVAAAASALAQTLPVKEVRLRSVPLSLPAEAIVEAVRQATIAAQVAGRVVDLRVDAGQGVRKGELLLRLDAREASENAAAAQATLINARAGFERVRNLHAQKFVSQAALDKARADLDAAQAASAAALAGASHATIVSPLAGIVARRHVEVGEMAALGRPLVTVYDPKGLRVVAAVPQYQLAALRGVREAWIEFPGLGRRVAATDIVVLPTVDAQTHSATVRVGLPADSGFAVPGMAAHVHFGVGRGERLTVPNEAVQRRGEVAAVYVQSGDRLALRQVRLGDAVADGEVEVLAGLAAGERVVLDPVKAGSALRQAATAK